MRVPRRRLAALGTASAARSPSAKAAEDHPEMSSTFFQFAVGCKQIMSLIGRRRRSPKPAKSALLLTYVRLLMKYLFLVKLLRRRLCRENIFGFRVHFFDYTTFRFLFSEVFLDEDYYFHTTSTCPFVIDCGANIGMALLYFKLLHPQARVVAFEPDEPTFRALEQNVHENRLQDVTLVNAALSDKDGEIEFFSDPAKPGAVNMSTKPARMSTQSRMVKAVRLSNYINEDFDFLKIDVEGAEKAVLGELAKEQKFGRVAEMAIEYHHHIERGEDDLSGFLGILEKCGWGYQLTARHGGETRGAFQDILIYAYAKEGQLRPRT
jgi:FkbM family methyltransferase